jgi:DNA-binding transcriptional LysR family regulator
MRLSLDALAVLDAIDRRGSFAAAAAELHRVPSAITYQVQKLEQDLDAAIFDRRARRARLTPAGRELLDAGRRLLEAAAMVERRVRRVASGWETELAVAVDAMIPWSRVWPLVAAFYRHCDANAAAHTRLRLLHEVFGGAWDALADGRADLVLGAAGDPPPGGGYRMRVLAESLQVFVVAPTHPLAAAPEPLSEAAVMRHRAIVAADTSRRLAARSLGIVAGQPTLTVPDLETKRVAQVIGLGCGFLPAHIAADDVASGRLVAKQVESPQDPVRLHVAWRESRPGNALAWWIDAVSRADWALGGPAAAPGSRKKPRARRTRLT